VDPTQAWLSQPVYVQPLIVEVDVFGITTLGMVKLVLPEADFEVKLPTASGKMKKSGGKLRINCSMDSVIYSEESNLFFMDEKNSS
jgi:hypothetical protein